jgi:iron complex outermembrane receptor protein
LIYGFNRKKIFEHQGILGEYLPLIPPFKFTSSLSQDIKVRSIIIPLITVKANIEMNGRQSRYLALDDTETGTPGYTLLNAGVGFRVDYTAAKSVLLQIQINNLLNAAYQSNLSRLKYFEYFSSSPTGHYGIYNMGRNCCVKAIFDF